MPLLTILIVSSFAFLLLRVLSIRYGRRRVRFPTPPGPKGWAWSVIGNLLDMPREYEWKTYREWSRLHGQILTYTVRVQLPLIFFFVDSDIIYATVLGQSVIVIDKYETAVDLLDKRSGIYSSR
jgi:hypothetical protein